MKRIWADLIPKPEGMNGMRKQKNCVILITALVILLTMVMPYAEALAEQPGIVKGGWLILRASPSFSGTIKSSYPSGTRVKITGKTGSWYAVTAPDGLTGYMLGDYLQVSGGSGGTLPVETTAYVTSANGLNVRLRSGPGKGYSILASYAPGTKCTILSAGNNWCRIQIGSYTGYMMTRYLTNTPNVPTPTPQPHPGPSGEYQVYVTSKNGKGVNLRSGPAKTYSSIGFYSVATPAMMITKGKTWSYIRVGNRYGYMMTQFLTESEPVKPIIPGGAYVVSANGKSVNLRAQATTASGVIRSFKVGTPLTIISRGTDWYFIQISGYYGYMMRQFIYDGGSPATTTDMGF